MDYLLDVSEINLWFLTGTRRIKGEIQRNCGCIKIKMFTTTSKNSELMHI
jgi:hypothetical protein